jgi:hypothetical protein
MSRRLIGALGVLILFLGLSNAANAQTDQIIYGDSLGAGWQDWSWSARDLASTDVVHSGSHSVKVTYTAAFQGFYLRHTAFDSSHYTALTFWINGGGSSGRSINVAAQLDDASQPSVTLNNYVLSVQSGKLSGQDLPLVINGLEASTPCSLIQGSLLTFNLSNAATGMSGAIAGLFHRRELKTARPMLEQNCRDWENGLVALLMSLNSNFAAPETR